MSDIISRQDAIDTVLTMFDRCDGDINDYRDLLVESFKVLPSQERKTGKWIERNPQNSDKCRLIECDQCGFAHIVGFNVPYEHWIKNRNFCERCGADMRKKGEK